MSYDGWLSHAMPESPPAPQAWIVMGVRRAKLRVRDHRYGHGKVHGLYYDRLNREWMVSCTRETETMMQGDRVGREVAVTCKKCINQGAH